MYIDLIIFILLIVLVLAFFRRFDSFVLSVGIIDIFLRILFFIRTNIIIKGLEDVIDRFLPSSVPGIIDRYLDPGVVNTIFKWIYVVIMCIFLYYVIRVFIKKKKI